MQFRFGNYTTKCQALEVGIRTACMISPLLYIMSMEVILRGAADTANGVVNNEQTVFLLTHGWHYHFGPRLKSVMMNCCSARISSSRGWEWSLNPRKNGAYHYSGALSGRFTSALGWHDADNQRKSYENSRASVWNTTGQSTPRWKITEICIRWTWIPQQNSSHGKLKACFY